MKAAALRPPEQRQMWVLDVVVRESAYEREDLPVRVVDAGHPW